MIPLKDDNPTSTFPFVTIALIAANIVVFVYEVSLGPEGVEAFVFRTAAIPYEVTRLTDLKPAGLLPPPLTLLTAIFVHGGLFHLLGNMLYLWIFGDNIEDRLGHLKFLLFYVAAGVAASLTHILIFPDSTAPMIGASGAIAGVLGAYFLYYPRARVSTLVYFLVFVRIVKVPAVFFLGLWFALQILSTAAGGGVAWFAHIGGFAAGMLLVLCLSPHFLLGKRR